MGPSFAADFVGAVAAFATFELGFLRSGSGFATSGSGFATSGFDFAASVLGFAVSTSGFAASVLVFAACALAFCISSGVGRRLTSICAGAGVGVLASCSSQAQW